MIIILSQKDLAQIILQKKFHRLAFDDNVLLFISCAEAEKDLHTTPNSQRLIDNLAIEDPLKYAALALDCELQDWANAMDEDWSP